MKVEFTKIENLCSERLSVYTCYIGENYLTEFEYFNEFTKTLTSKGHLEELYILKAILAKMKQNGAKSYYFKFENSAHALPKLDNAKIVELNNSDYGIRLYCIRINDNNLILLNGQIKTHQNPLKCDRVRPHFMNANNIAKKIDRAIAQKQINILEKDSLLDLEIEI